MSGFGLRGTALVLLLTLSAASGCGKTAPPAPVDDTRSAGPLPGNPPNSARTVDEPKSGIGTGTKVVMLAGAAALYYLYKQHQNATAATGENGQYYLSKNGRVYYRDSEHRAHWVTPPADGVRVPEAQARDYQQFQGYDGNNNGRDLAGLADQ